MSDVVCWLSLAQGGTTNTEDGQKQQGRIASRKNRDDIVALRVKWFNRAHWTWVISKLLCKAQQAGADLVEVVRSNLVRTSFLILHPCHWLDVKPGFPFLTGKPQAFRISSLDWLRFHWWKSKNLGDVCWPWSRLFRVTWFMYNLIDSDWLPYLQIFQHAFGDLGFIGGARNFDI